MPEYIASLMIRAFGAPIRRRSVHQQICYRVARPVAGPSGAAIRNYQACFSREIHTNRPARFIIIYPDLIDRPSKSSSSAKEEWGCLLK